LRRRKDKARPMRETGARKPEVAPGSRFGSRTLMDGNVIDETTLFWDWMQMLFPRFVERLIPGPRCVPRVAGAE
jgi:hypothetical protein